MCVENVGMTVGYGEDEGSFSLMDVDFLDAEADCVEGCNASSSPLVATSATTATSSEVSAIVNDFSCDTATTFATTATNEGELVEVDRAKAEDREMARAKDRAEVEMAKDRAKVAEEEAKAEERSVASTPILEVGFVGQPVLVTSVLMTNQRTGKPIRCSECGRWHNVAGSAWWIGECDLCGQRKHSKDRCSILSTEWQSAQGYV